MRPSPICCLPLGFRTRARHTAPGRRQARAIVFSLSLFLDLPCVQCTQTQPCCRLINNPVKSAVKLKPTPPNPFFIRIHQAYSTFLFSLASVPTALQGAGAPSVLAGSRLGRRRRACVSVTARRLHRSTPAHAAVLSEHWRRVRPASLPWQLDATVPLHRHSSTCRRAFDIDIARAVCVAGSLHPAPARLHTAPCAALAPSHSRALRVVRGQAPRPATLRVTARPPSHSRSHCSVLPPRVICEARLHHETRTKPKRLA